MEAWRRIRSPSCRRWTTALRINRRSEGSWWERGWKGDSFTFAAANKNYEHFLRQRFGQSDQTRATVSATYTPTDSRLSNVKIGDTIYFLNRKTDEYTHMGIVTDVKRGLRSTSSRCTSPSTAEMAARVPAPP
ncbi:amidase domain-containing protein [Microtetraspora malaysiensis]|uniref:Amidase domain-containing protein n=1 Tax=Microtetraspora malaysiensis TaxID=161358 RepID=A0ABW6T0Q1_9ACTN